MDKHTYLAHHGILGMKWGIRRFQNKDGSYTAAGKRRRQEADDAAESVEPNTSSSSESQQTAQAPPVPTPDEAPQREGMSPAQRRALLLAGAGVVAAATIIGVSIYNEKNGGAKKAGKEFVDGLKDVKVPKIDVADDAAAAKDAADAVFKSRELEKKLQQYAMSENPDPEVYRALGEAWSKASDNAKSALRRKGNVENFVKNNKDVILGDPALVKKYSDYLSEKDIASVANKLNNMNKLHDARVKQAKAGAEWLGVITATGTAIQGVTKLVSKKNQGPSQNQQQNQKDSQKEKEQ